MTAPRFLLGVACCGILAVLFTLRGMHFEINEQHPCTCQPVKGCACKPADKCACKDGKCCQPQKSAPKCDALDLGFDLLILTPGEVMLSYTNAAGKEIKFTMTRADFDTMYGRVHIEPRTPAEQKAGALATVELRAGK